MFLNEIAQRNTYEVMDGWDAETMEFTPASFTGRIDLTDRFLSIYNRPTRKRQLFTKPGEPLPESHVFRHAGSGDIYILGQMRQDARHDVNDGEAYIAISMLHLVTPNALGSSGLAVQTRRVAKGPADDPGWLVEEEISTTFLDIEFRTSSSEEGVHDSKIENFYAWTPITVEAEQWDFFELNGRRYRTVDTFTDIGMRGLRLDREGDPRVDLVVTTNERVYDRVEHKWISNKRPYNVTAIVPVNTDIAAWTDTRENSRIELAIDFGNIGFRPEVNQEVTYQERTRIIKSVQTQAGEKQYRVTCE